MPRALDERAIGRREGGELVALGQITPTNDTSVSFDLELFTGGSRAQGFIFLNDRIEGLYQFICSSTWDNVPEGPWKMAFLR